MYRSALLWLQDVTIRQSGSRVLSAVQRAVILPVCVYMYILYDGTATHHACTDTQDSTNCAFKPSPPVIHPNPARFAPGCPETWINHTRHPTVPWIDAVPGRANTLRVCSAAPGILFGQCSEICGTLHGYMPIAVASAMYGALVRTINIRDAMVPWDLGSPSPPLDLPVEPGSVLNSCCNPTLWSVLVYAYTTRCI